MRATMDEAMKRGMTFELGTVEDLHSGEMLGPVAMLLDDQGEYVATLASSGDLADLGRFLGVLPREAVAA